MIRSHTLLPLSLRRCAMGPFVFKAFGSHLPSAALPCHGCAGKSASGLKEVADSFAEGMNEGETGVSKDGGKDAIKSASADESTTE